MFSSLVFTMWIGFGQTVAKNVGTYVVPNKATSIEGCPEAWHARLDNITAMAKEKAEPSDGG